MNCLHYVEMSTYMAQWPLKPLDVIEGQIDDVLGEIESEPAGRGRSWLAGIYRALIWLRDDSAQARSPMSNAPGMATRLAAINESFYVSPLTFTDDLPIRTEADATYKVLEWALDQEGKVAAPMAWTAARRHTA